MTTSARQPGGAPPIPIDSTALILNDMINASLRRENDAAHNLRIEESRLIPNTMRLVAATREKGVPVFWVRVERRPDRSDVVDNLIDAPAYAWHTPNPLSWQVPIQPPMSTSYRSNLSIRSSLSHG